MEPEFVFLITFDAETTGPRILEHAMTELGICVFNSLTSEVIDTFSVHIQKPEGRDWDAKCLSDFWNNRMWESMKEGKEKEKKKEEFEVLDKKRKRIDENHGEAPNEAMKRVVAFIDKIWKENAKGDRLRIKFASDTASFDVTWVNYYLDKYANHNPLHVFFDGEFSDVLCTSSFAQGLSCTSHEGALAITRKQGWYSEDVECRRVLNVPTDRKPTAKHNHEAVSDAQYIGSEHLIQAHWGKATYYVKDAIITVHNLKEEAKKVLATITETSNE